MQKQHKHAKASTQPIIQYNYLIVLYRGLLQDSPLIVSVIRVKGAEKRHLVYTFLLQKYIFVQLAWGTLVFSVPQGYGDKVFSVPQGYGDKDCTKTARRVRN